MHETSSANGPATVRDALAARQSEGWQRLERGQAQAACLAFQQAIATALEQAGEGTFPESLRAALQQAVLGIDRCLPLLAEEAPHARLGALQALFQAYEADVRQGANGLAGEAAFSLLRHAGPQERLQVSGWVRRELGAARDEPAAEQYWRLLLDLEALDPGSLDAVFEQCRAAGRARLVAEKLLDLDRVGEALILARRELHDTDELLGFAGSPAAHGHVRAVMVLVEERLSRSIDPRLADWLATRYAERGDLPQALEVRLKLLHKAPDHADPEQLQDLARRLGRWEKLRPQVERALCRA
jgi:tetratricopeptide (TPR) repeat protein